MKNVFQKIKQWLLNMQNVRIMARRFRKELIKVLEIEQKESDKYNQRDYASCYDRSVHMINDAIEPVKKMEAYAIACHREKTHHESHMQEKIELEKSMPEADQLISARGWWNK